MFKVQMSEKMLPGKMVHMKVGEKKMVEVKVPESAVLGSHFIVSLGGDPITEPIEPVEPFEDIKEASLGERPMKMSEIEPSFGKQITAGVPVVPVVPTPPPQAPAEGGASLTGGEGGGGGGAEGGEDGGERGGGGAKCGQN
jgi:hypothetical protein